MGARKRTNTDPHKFTTSLPATSNAGTQSLESSLFEKRIAGKDIEHDRLADEWLSPTEAASYLRISIGSLRNMTSNGELPFYKLGRRVRYLKEELRVLLLAQRRGVPNGY